MVLKWNRAIKHFERQGILVEKEALEKAEQECLQDGDIRERRRHREAEKREQTDQEYVRQFALRIRELFPSCPDGRESDIAEHACQKYSGRVGRTTSAKDLSEKPIRLAVRAHIRHTMTDYDDLLSKGFDRYDAGDLVENRVAEIISE